MYRSEVEQLLPGAGSAEIAPGSVLSVVNARGAALGSAIFSSASQITLRLVSEAPSLNRLQYLA